jgi:hypothetical protein
MLSNPALFPLTCSLIFLANIAAGVTAAESDASISIGYVAANGAAVEAANDSTVYHVTMADAAAGGSQPVAPSMRFWCNGFATAGGWDVCKWTRPGGSGPCGMFENIVSCDNNTAGGFTAWSVRRTPTNACELEVVGANQRDAGEWTCFLLPKNVTVGAVPVARLRRQAVSGTVAIETPAVDAPPISPGSAVDLDCRISALTHLIPAVYWFRRLPTGESVTLPGNLTHIANITTADGDPGWNLTNRLTFTTGTVIEQLICRAVLLDNFGHQLIRSADVTLEVAGGAGDGEGGGLAGKQLEVGLAVGLGLLLLLLILLLVSLLCWCFGLACFHGRRRGAHGLRKKKLQVGYLFGSR